MYEIECLTDEKEANLPEINLADPELKHNYEMECDPGTCQPDFHCNPWDMCNPNCTCPPDS